MRVGSASSGSVYSSHQSGMSSLWHDTDYLPDKSVHVPQVARRFDDAPLPSEEHQLPKGFDAFSKMDEVYEVAGEQMDRGIDAQSFLYGKRSVAAATESRLKAHDAAPAPDELTQTIVAQRHMGGEADIALNPRGVQETKEADAQIRKRDSVGNQPTKVSNATNSANASQDAKRSEKALEMAEGIGVMMAAVAAGQAIDPATGSMAAEAASVVKAVSTAKTAVGMTHSMKEMPGTTRSEHLQKGLAERRRMAEHQPSLEPGPDVGHQPSLDPGDGNHSKD